MAYRSRYITYILGCFFCYKACFKFWRGLSPVNKAKWFKMCQFLTMNWNRLRKLPFLNYKYYLKAVKWKRTISLWLIQNVWQTFFFFEKSQNIVDNPNILWAEFWKKIILNAYVCRHKHFYVILLNIDRFWMKNDTLENLFSYFNNFVTKLILTSLFTCFGNW